MEFLFPLAAIVSEASAKTIDKLNFSHNRISASYLMQLVFVGMSGALLVYVVVASVPLPVWSVVAAGLMVLIAVVSFAGNVFDYLSLKSDDLSLREPMFGFEPILAGLFGYIFFTSDRDPVLLPAFLLSALVVYFGTHQRRLGRLQKKGMFYLLLAVLLYALLPSIYKATLPYVSPEYIALFRVTAILALTFLFFPIKAHKRRLKKGRSGRQLIYGLTSGVIYAVGTVASLYAIQKFGVAQAMLFLMLGPALIYLSGYFILKEKERKGEIISSACLAVIVLVATAL